MKEKKKKLLTNLVSSFLTLLSVCLLIALLINLRFHQDCATVIVGMLSVCATLYAPVAAFFFYDSWKDQKKYDLNKELLLEIDNILYSIYEEIGKHSRRAKTLKKVENEKVQLEKSLETRQLHFHKEINDLYQKIALFDALNDSNLKDAQYNFCLIVFRLGIILDKIYQPYEQYSKILNMGNSHLTCTSSYKANEKSKASNSIDNLITALDKKYDFSTENEDGSIKEEILLTFSDLSGSLDSSYSTLREQIIEYISP